MYFLKHYSTHLTNKLHLKIQTEFTSLLGFNNNISNPEVIIICMAIIIL